MNCCAYAFASFDRDRRAWIRYRERQKVSKRIRAHARVRKQRRGGVTRQSAAFTAIVATVASASQLGLGGRVPVGWRVDGRTEIQGLRGGVLLVDQNRRRSLVEMLLTDGTPATATNGTSVTARTTIHFWRLRMLNRSRRTDSSSGCSVNSGSFRIFWSDRNTATFVVSTRSETPSGRGERCNRRSRLLIRETPSARSVYAVKNGIENEIETPRLGFDPMRDE